MYNWDELRIAADRRYERRVDAFAREKTERNRQLLIEAIKLVSRLRADPRRPLSIGEQADAIDY